MEAAMMIERLSEAIESGHEVTILLRGAHKITIASASARATSSEEAGLARFDITGLIGIDGGSPERGRTCLSSNDVAAIFIKDPITHNTDART